MSLEDLSPEARDELAALMRELAENPNTRKSVLKLAKQVRPNMNIDTLEIEEQVEQRLQQSNAKLEELEAKLREKDALETLERRRRELVAKGKARSEEDVAAIEKIMLEKGIQNHETAADYFEWMNQAAKPTSVATFKANVMDETARDTLSKYWKNPAAAAREEASKALNDLRKNPRPIGF